MKSLEYLKQLIRFPSVSCDSNLEVSRWVEQTLQKLDFETEWIEYQDRNGVAKACVSGRKGPESGRGMAYFCHSDVVPVASWSFPDSGPWQPYQTEDRIYGRGSCDMKGSLACMLAAVERHPSGILSEPIHIVCTADEEVGLQGARYLAQNSAMYRTIVARQCRAIIGEPTLLEVIHAHKGGRAMKITSRGLAAHSSTGNGINANMTMIPFLSGVHAMCAEIDGDPAWQDDRYVPPTISLNLGINDHTYALNITPAQSVCTVYFRTMPTIDAEVLVDRIRLLADQCGLQFELLFAGDPVFTDPDSAFIHELLQLTGTSTSHTVPYGTDGSCFSDLTDMAILGPGSIEQAHKDDEWISLEQLKNGTELYSKLIQQWCTKPS
jgi:acetylornithine deacetylase